MTDELDTLDMADMSDNEKQYDFKQVVIRVLIVFAITVALALLISYWR